MKFFLVQIANLAVVMHLTFGCNWHHGLNSVHSCSDERALISDCCSEQTEIEPKCGDHDEHNDHEHQPKTSAIVSGESHADSEHEHCHHGCMDDGCNVNIVEREFFSPIDFSIAYVGGCECLEELNTGHASTLVSLPDLLATALKVRSHLLLGVQLL